MFWLFAGIALPARGVPRDVPYQTNCSACHGADRLGGIGPALLPENLSRLKKPEAARMIRDSRPGVQMPAFKDKLSDNEVAQLVELVYSPVVPAPRWGEAEIRASRVVHKKPESPTSPFSRPTR